MKDEENYNFWKQQARENQYDVKAVNFDILEENLEFFYLNGLIEDGSVICDMGCGNGRTIIEIAKTKPGTKFIGLDFVEEMIDIAIKEKHDQKLHNVEFFSFDAGAESIDDKYKGMFDTILTKRLLINLKGERKYQAIRNIHRMLKPDGKYIMMECFIEPLQRVNEIRTRFNLPEIKVWHFNEYLTEKFVCDVEQYFLKQKKMDFESLYYFVSRIFNAYLSGGKPEYTAPINRLAIELSKMGVSVVEDYSPEKIIVFRKKNKIYHKEGHSEEK
jgi:ubiquinone/menaquinone biosynthesis C-methylase UbiE